MRPFKSHNHFILAAVAVAVVSFFNYPSFVMNFGILIGIPLLLGLILGFFLGMRQARPRIIKEVITK